MLIKVGRTNLFGDKIWIRLFYKELKEGVVYWNPSNILPAGKSFFEEDFKICSELSKNKLSECDETFHPEKRPIIALEIRKPGKRDLKIEVCNPDSVCKRIDWILQPEWKVSIRYFDWNILPGISGKYKIQVIDDLEILKTWIIEKQISPWFSRKILRFFL